MTEPSFTWLYGGIQGIECPICGEPASEIREPYDSFYFTLPAQCNGCRGLGVGRVDKLTAPVIPQDEVA